MSRSRWSARARRLLAPVVAAALCGATALLGGLAAAPGAAAAPNNGTFTTTLYTSIQNLDPFLAHLAGETEVIGVTYPELTWGNEVNKEVPYLARSWKVSPDKKTWTFHLEKGLKWSDGKPLTAGDVAWTFNLIMHNTTAGTANGSLVANFKAVTAPSAGTVAITTKTPQANMLNLVGAIPIVPQHIWAAKVKNLAKFTNTAPYVGYGPFRMTGYKADQYVTLQANKSFFLGAPRYDTVVLDYFKNSGSAVAALRTGQVDATDDLTATEYHALQHVKGIKTYQTEANAWVAVEANIGARTRSGKHIGDGNPVLHNPAVRRAIADGIDRKTLVAEVLRGTGSPGSTYLPPAFPEWKWTPPRSAAETYDPAKANAMLTAAGLPRGSNGYRYDKKTHKELSLRLGIHSDNDTDAQIADYMVGWMKAIGIKLTVQAMSTRDLNDQLAKGNFDLLSDARSTGEDPTYLLGIQTCGVLPLDNGTGGNTDSFYCNKAYDRLYAAEQSTFSQKQRAADIKQMEAMLYKANNDIILYYNNTTSAVRDSYAKGYVYGHPDRAGFYPQQNEQLGWIRAVPPDATGAATGIGAITGPIALAVIVVIGGLVFARRRRATLADRG